MTRDDPVPTTPGMVEVLQKAYDTFKPPSVPSDIDKPLPYPAPDMRMKRPRQGDKNSQHRGEARGNHQPRKPRGHGR